MRKMTKLIIFMLTFIVIQGPAWSMDVLAIGIAGGSCSGKTTLAKSLKNVAPQDVLILSQDFYYKDLSHLSLEERGQINFDHPSSIDFKLLEQHLIALKNGQSIEMPQYDFATHGRKKETVIAEAKPIVIVEGILIFTKPEVRELLDLKVFIDANDELRLDRRIDRDQSERGRSLTSIQAQYSATVAPMYEKFVRPSKVYADVYVSGEKKPELALQTVQNKIKHTLVKMDLHVAEAYS